MLKSIELLLFSLHYKCFLWSVFWLILYLINKCLSNWVTSSGMPKICKTISFFDSEDMRVAPQSLNHLRVLNAKKQIQFQSHSDKKRHAIIILAKFFYPQSTAHSHLIRINCNYGMADLCLFAQIRKTDKYHS